MDQKSIGVTLAKIKNLALNDFLAESETLVRSYALA